MNVLVACEFSGTVRNAFREKGHNAWSCDLLESEDNSEFHYTGDIFKFVEKSNIKWDLMIGHPPCTYLSLSGARWCTDHIVKSKKGDWFHDGSFHRQSRDRALDFFRKLWNLDIPRICLENPMSVASTHVAKKSQTIQPWQFGHPEFKTTWLWLKNLPLLKPTNIINPPDKNTEEFKKWSVVHYMSPNDDRWKERSRTYKNIGTAMANQWNF